jgi:hypothetical protein
MNVKKTKVMVFNYVDPCQEFVFESDVIKRVQTFKYLRILLETTPNLDNTVEHLAAASRRSLQSELKISSSRIDQVFYFQNCFFLSWTNQSIFYQIKLYPEPHLPQLLNMNRTNWIGKVFFAKGKVE